MSDQLVQAVLPRLARTLYRELPRLWDGEMTENEFTEGFEKLLEKQHAWLISRGAPKAQAALAIHGALLVLSLPGLRSEAAEKGVPLEILEQRAVRDAGQEVSRNYGISEGEAIRVISGIVARYGD